MSNEMPNGVQLIRFKLDCNFDWVEARDDEPTSKTCMARAEQVARARAKEDLRLKPHGNRVRVCQVETNRYSASDFEG